VRPNVGVGGGVVVPLVSMGGNCSTSSSANPSTQEDKFKKPFTIFVEGNVGSGKSTTLSYFANRTGEQI
jgi:polynucleotide 5'-kinase involved in rRNA processing